MRSGLRTWLAALGVMGALTVGATTVAPAAGACEGCSNENCRGTCYCASNFGTSCNDGGLVLANHNCSANGDE